MKNRRRDKPTWWRGSIIANNFGLRLITPFYLLILSHLRSLSPSSERKRLSRFRPRYDLEQALILKTQKERPDPRAPYNANVVALC